MEPSWASCPTWYLCGVALRTICSDHFSPEQGSQNSDKDAMVHNHQCSAGCCDWLSVQQLAMYQTILLVYKVMKTGSPAYIHSMFSTEYERPTRMALQGLLKPSTTSKIPSTELASSSFRHRALLQYNLLPVHVRDASNENLFKSLAKIWIVENIPVDWGFNISMVMFTTPFISDGWKFTQK